jgi:hypothetical protein
VQVSEGIHRLTQGVTNFYLIEESGKYTLVDAGTPADWAFFAPSIAGLGGKLADLDAVPPATRRAARRSRSRAAGRCSPATSWPRRTPSPGGSARRSCRPG